jgi:hypothetical protein
VHDNQGSQEEGKNAPPPEAQGDQGVFPKVLMHASLAQLATGALEMEQEDGADEPVEFDALRRRVRPTTLAEAGRFPLRVRGSVQPDWFEIVHRTTPRVTQSESKPDTEKG